MVTCCFFFSKSWSRSWQWAQLTEQWAVASVRPGSTVHWNWIFAVKIRSSWSAAGLNMASQTTSELLLRTMFAALGTEESSLLKVPFQKLISLCQEQGQSREAELILGPSKGLPQVHKGGQPPRLAVTSVISHGCRLMPGFKDLNCLCLWMQHKPGCRNSTW